MTMTTAFLIGWVTGLFSGAACAVCLSALRVAGTRAADDGDGIQDDFTPAMVRWNRMGRKWGWL